MDHIETKILNSYTIQEAAQNMVFAARLTQQGHSIQNMNDLITLYQKSFTDKTVDRIASLPHPTVQKFTVITVAIVGASRRFLAQITRHQNEVSYHRYVMVTRERIRLQREETNFGRCCFFSLFYGYKVTISETWEKGKKKARRIERHAVI